MYSRSGVALSVNVNCPGCFMIVNFVLNFDNAKDGAKLINV